MTNLHSLTSGFYCVELPEGAINVEVSDSTLTYECIAFDEPCQELTLPAGTYSFLGMASDVGEEVAAEMVEVGKHPVYGKCYKNYQFDESKPENDHGNPRYYRYATTALTSKIRSLGIEPKRAGIMKRIENTPSQG